ncbi:MAG: GNAT family N-acetyltransferase [Psychroflexus sp.]|nr:GNAT family N-acetyltransferase [Psychroflexus sp.]MDN6310601.1 GNAT family N-acetyltransferase [Psychroflexus sp.]
MRVIIETKRLVIKQRSHQDIGDLLAIYQSSENMKFVPNARLNWTKKELWEKYTRINQKYKLGIGIYILLRKEDRSVMGETGLYNSFDNLKHLELGYILDRKYWNKGYGTEICKALIKYAFAKLKVEKLTARMIKDNVASKRVSKKCRMTFLKEGISENAYPYLEYEIRK